MSEWRGPPAATRAQAVWHSLAKSMTIPSEQLPASRGPDLHIKRALQEPIISNIDSCPGLCDRPPQREKNPIHPQMGPSQ